MTATLLDGKATAATIRGELKARIEALRERGIEPGLGTVLVGDDPASHAYVRGKHRDCAEVGIRSIGVELPATATQAEVEAVVDELNADPACTAYLVQLPLPAGLRAQPGAGPDRPGQGRRRAAPDEPRLARARPAGAAAVHAARLRRAAPPVRRADRRRRRWSWSAAGITAARALPLLLTRRVRERDRDDLPHRHPGPAGGAAARRTSSWPPPARPGWSGPSTCGPARPCSTWASPAPTPGWSATWTRRSARSAGFLAPVPGGIGPMTRAMLLTNVVEAAEAA